MCANSFICFIGNLRKLIESTSKNVRVTHFDPKSYADNYIEFDQNPVPTWVRITD